MPIYNLKGKERVLPEKETKLVGFSDSDVDESHKLALKNIGKHTIEDPFKKTKKTKMGEWFFTTEAFHFYRPKGVNANYEITIIDHITLHMMAHSMQEALKLLEDEIREGESNVLQGAVDDINRLLQKKHLHEQHNLAWIPPIQQSEFQHHIPAGNPGEIHVQSEDTGFIEYPSDMNFIRIHADEKGRIKVKLIMSREE